jgi:F-type H+-transporting ATPase subunit a
MADFTFIDLFPEIAEKNHSGHWNEIFGDPLLNPGNAVTISHLIWTGVAVAIIIVLALIARGKYSDRDEALIPEPRLSVRNFFEVIFDATLSMMSDMMGEKQAKRFFPLIATLAIFILIGNLMGLVPGLAPPTQNWNTNLACAAVVFVFYNVVGLRENGVAYLKHFLGPVLWLGPLMLVIEVVGHVFRPISLSIRLTGNMTGDHMVLGVFGDLAGGIFAGMPLLLPVPFLFLGLLVSVIQTLVFCLLSAIYIALAVEHEEEHH